MADEKTKDQQAETQETESTDPPTPSASAEQPVEAAPEASAQANTQEHTAEDIPTSPAELGEDQTQTETEPESTPEPQRSSGSEPEASPLPDFSNMLAEAAAGSIEMLNDVDLNVKVELGRSQLTVDEILRLTEGYVVELNKLAGDPVDVLVNEQLVARGEVLVVNDSFCVRINEIIPGVSEKAVRNTS